LSVTRLGFGKRIALTQLPVRPSGREAAGALEALLAALKVKPAQVLEQ
jgi:hypothetical protein